MIFLNKDSMNEDLMIAVALEQLRKCGAPIAEENDGYDCPDKTPEEIEALKAAARKIVAGN